MTILGKHLEANEPDPADLYLLNIYKPQIFYHSANNAYTQGTTKPWRITDRKKTYLLYDEIFITKQSKHEIVVATQMAGVDVGMATATPATSLRHKLHGTPHTATFSELAYNILTIQTVSNEPRKRVTV